MKHYLKTTNVVYMEAERRLLELREAERRTVESLRNAPAGKIHVVTEKNRVKFYVRRHPTEHTGTYLGKSKTEIARKYLQKSYDEKLLETLITEIAGLEWLCENMKTYPSEIKGLIESFPTKARELIIPVDVPDDVLIREWKAIPYEKKPISYDKFPYETEQKEIVRSKSELNIANALYKAGIPYKYECPLRLKNGAIIYPDFTILDLVHRRIIYWEHLGMMDDRTYARDAVKRMKDYQKLGIYPGDGLIITQELEGSLLGTTEIREVIEHYLK